VLVSEVKLYNIILNSLIIGYNNGKENGKNIYKINMDNRMEVICLEFIKHIIFIV
jgi:hypothetical protein